MPKPICFMIMPYGKKPTQAEAGRGVPEIDFNALWDRAFTPTIVALGYEPVRADQDTGALIITQMIERLYFADLVLADMTIPNGNVYYEIGVRHAAKEKGCVLLAADWSKQLFDVAQMRTIRYPLVEGNIEPPTAQAIASAIRAPIEALRRGGSPVFNSIKGYPSHVEPGVASTMKGAMAKSAAFQGGIRAVRALPVADRMSRAKALAEELMQASRHRDDRARGASAAQGFRRLGRGLELDHRLHRQASGGCRRSRRGPRDACLCSGECRPAGAGDRKARGPD